MSQGGANSNSGSGGTPVESLTGNSGGPVSPDGAFNIDILGNNTTGIDIVGTPASNLLTVIGLPSSTTQIGTVELATAVETGTLTDSTRAITPNSLEPILVTPYVVAPGGAYTTIQSAMDAANAAGGGTVYIRQGSYTENLTFYDQVYLMAVNGISQGPNEGVEIIGSHTPPLSGHTQANGVYFQTSTSIFSSAAAGTTHIQLANCEFAIQNGYVFDMLNWTGTLEIYDCNPFSDNPPFVINDGGINNTGGSSVIVYNSGLGNGTNTATISGNATFGQAVTVACPVNFVTGTSLISVGSQYNSLVTFSNNSTAVSTNDSYIVTSGPAITMSSSATVTLAGVVISSSNNPAITGAGAGTLNLDNVTFLDNTSVAGTLTIAHPSTTEGGTFFAQTVNVGTRSPSNPYNISIEDSVSGTIGQSIQNTSAGAAAAATVQLIVEPAVADPYVGFFVNGGGNFALGIDNSDSDTFKITTGSTPSGGTTAIDITSAGIVTLPGGALDVPSGGTGLTTITDHGVMVGSGTAAVTPLAVGTDGQVLVGSTGADPVFATIASSDSLLTLTGGAGTLDITANQAVSASAVLTDNTVVMGDGGVRGVQNTTITVTDNGEMTNSSQPAFGAHVASTITNVTGNNTNYTIIFDTEDYDQNSDFNLASSTFTAPVTGVYEFGVSVFVTGRTTANDYTLYINTSARNYLFRNSGPPSGDQSISNVTQVSLTASDTVTFSIQVNGNGSDNMGILGAANPYSFCWGRLVC